MSRISRDEKARPARVSVASSRAPLVVKGLDQKNFFQKWVLDVDDRIQNFIEAGYDFVRKEPKVVAGEKTVETSEGLDSRISKPAGRGLRLFLMQQPIKFRKEDQKAKDREIDLTEEAIKPSNNKDVDAGKMSLGSSNKMEPDTDIDWSHS
jgi:hypothetical protein